MRRALLLLFLAAPSRAAMVINEVSFDNPSGDWVELYNPGPGAASVDGWKLDDRDTAGGNEITLLFPTPVPAGAFLVVFVDAAGAADADFSDDRGAVFTGTATTVGLAATEDELGLYSGPLSSATLIDFVAWVTEPPYGGASDQGHAGGQWPAGDSFALADAGAGYTIGRAVDGQDTDAPADWRFFSRGTPGLSNVPAPSPFTETLRAAPRAFSPHDPDPAFQATRLFFNAAADAVKTIRILDSRGRPVRTLIDQDRGAAGDFVGVASGAVLWNGLDDGGTVVPVGVYIVIFDAGSPAGSTGRARAVVAVGKP